jgi:hypothetical protein
MVLHDTEEGRMLPSAILSHPIRLDSLAALDCHLNCHLVTSLTIEQRILHLASRVESLAVLEGLGRIVRGEEVRRKTFSKCLTIRLGERVFGAVSR